MELSPAASTILVGDVFDRLAEMPDESVHCVVTSPPYWALRDYGTGAWEGGDPDCDHIVPRGANGKDMGFNERVGRSSGARKQETAKEQRYAERCERCGAARVDQQLGLEGSPEEYIDRMVAVFREVRRVLRPDGTLWLNIGDSYASKTRGSDNGWDKSRLSNPGTVQKAQAASLRSTGERHRGKEAGLKEKDLVGIPWMLAFALRDDGWWLRRDNIWSKRNPMPESTSDRTTSAHEYMFMLTKASRYFYDADAVREPAEWARWGDQTVPKHNGTATKIGWIQPKTIAELADVAKRPAGWSSLPGRHGAIHPNGRDKGNRKTFRGGGAYTARQTFDNGTSTENDSVGNDAGGHLGRNKRSVWEIAEEQEDAAAWLADLFLETMRAGEERLADTVWSIATQPYAQAHFATFPQKLVEPCVMAGTSERGVCPDCAAPWERAAVRVRTFDGEEVPNGPAWALAGAPRRMPVDGAGHRRWATITKSEGWRPTCACYDGFYRIMSPRPHASKRWQNITWWERARARPGRPEWPTVPATVLDPFSGAATTLLVSKRLRRASIGIELNADYAELGRRRLERWWSKPPRAAKPVSEAQLDLLAPIEGGAHA